MRIKVLTKTLMIFFSNKDITHIFNSRSVHASLYKRVGIWLNVLIKILMGLTVNCH